LSFSDQSDSHNLAQVAPQKGRNGGVIGKQLAKSTLLFKALTFAAHKHRLQTRKGKEPIPYINHPIAVANLLVNVGKVTDTATILAAILHDTVEDTPTTLQELKKQFGPAVSKLVAEVSDDKNLPSEQRKRLQIEHASTLSRRARLIKLADKTCNLRDVVGDPPKGWSLERKREYFDWAERVVEKVRGTNPALEHAFDAAFSKRP
jgi:GTP diphosphokinase / guanosine-3',5'-bis(diphosphate) 3'-diphosphatase